MRLSSLRVRFLALTVLFALILVGTVSIVAYVVVTEAMIDTAESSLLNVADTANELLRERITEAKLTAAAQGLSGAEADEAAYRTVLASLPEILSTGAAAEGAFALYDERLELIWFTDPSALNSHEVHRLVATSDERTVDTGGYAVRELSGLFTPADLGEYVTHVPIELPGMGTGVLDVTYLPLREEATIDRIRPWMLLLAVVSTVIAIVLMQVSTGWVLGLIGDLRRATDAIEAEELDIHLPDVGRHEIGDLARALNRLVDRLRRRAEAQTRFVADASHEIATPVAGIRGYVNILREWGAEDPAVRDEAIEAIDRESARMSRLAGDLLSLIRREEFTDMQIRRMDVNAVVRESLATAATRYMDKGIEFVGPEEGTLIAYADRDRVAQLLDILLDNAAKYTAQGGSVTVSTHRRLENVSITVTDTGIGIPASELPHIFDRFFRADESRSAEPGGFGIGLAVAYQLIRMMGGTIDVESVEGEGTSFTVTLPRKPHEGEVH